MALTQAARRLLAMVHRPGAPRLHELAVDQARHSYRKLQLGFCPAAPAGVTARTVIIPRPDGDGMAARLYRPQEAAPRAALPVFVFYHGGGWCVGDLECYDAFCCELVHDGGTAVLAVDYRLAPEHPFPAAPEDAILAARWVRAEGRRFGLDPLRIALGGDSAGGALAIVAALALRDEGGTQPKLLALAYPCTEIDATYPSRERYADGYVLERAGMEWFVAHFRGDIADWRASPMRAPSLAGLPPMLLIAAEYDPLIDEGAAFTARMAKEGGKVERIVVPGVVHGFLCLGKLFPEAGAMIRKIASRLEEALQGDDIPERGSTG
jgi:acetyl esterase